MVPYLLIVTLSMLCWIYTVSSAFDLYGFHGANRDFPLSDKPEYVVRLVYIASYPGLPMFSRKKSADLL